MHSLSARQESMLKELQEMTGRIEKLSEAEHALIKEVHPTVADIKGRVEDVQDAVGSEKAAGKQ
jgi:predicted transcriptional regulator